MGSEDNDRERMIDKKEMKKMVHDAVGAYFSSPAKLHHEIYRLRAENEKLRKALKPFAHNYQNNGLSHSMFIFEMKDLLAAKKALGDTDE